MYKKMVMSNVRMCDVRCVMLQKQTCTYLPTYTYVEVC